MIEIYGPPGTSASRCYWALEEMGLPYKRQDFSFQKGDHKSAWFQALNPNGKVPVIKDGELVLYESVAINHYLAEKYAPSLLGTTLEDKAKVLQWGVWSVCEYQKNLIQLFIQEVFVPKERRDAKLIAACLKKAEPQTALLNEHLRTRNFMVGSEFSLADLHIASVAKIGMSVKIPYERYYNLNRFLMETLSRPAAKRLAEMEQA